MKHLVLLFLLMTLLSSCVKNNPDPSWLEVNSWTLLANADLTNIEGELTHNFSDAWVYVDDKLIGVFEVPFKIPVLNSGAVNIKIYPAIRNNGISATKIIYPFVEVYEINTTLIQNQTITLNPTTKYYSHTTFWIEDFEDAAIKIQDDPNSQSSIQAGNDPAILQWGNSYGEVNLNDVDTTWVGYTNVQMDLPRGKQLYLEVDYRSTNTLITGILAISSTSIINNQNIQLNAQDGNGIVKWKKIYIDLREVVSNASTADYYELSFQALLDYGLSSSQIIIDNIKVVHF